MQFSLAIVTTLALAFLGFVPQAFSFTQAEACADYAVGEGHVFREIKPPTPTRHYSVVRDSETAYSVYVNVDFLGNQSIKSKVQECLTDVNKIGLGSESQNIFLHLYEDGITRAPAPRKILIQVHEKFDRANSKNFPLTFGCSSIVHELLHSAGLDDEYQELSLVQMRVLPMTRETPAGESRPEKPAYDCRALSDSVMSESYAYDLTQPRYTYRTEMVGSPDFTGWTYVKTRLYPLRPAHIRKLLWPHCRSNNQVYDQCIANAYRTSQKNGGRGCFPAPWMCSQKNAWLE